MGKKPKQWRRRNSTLAAGLREKSKGEKGNQAEDSDGWEDDGRRTWSGVGFLKRIQLLFVAAPRSSAWLRRLPPPPAPAPLPFPISFPIPSSGFYNFLLVRCVFFCASLFFWFCFFFSFSFYSEFANELRLKTKITCKARKVPKEERETEKPEGNGGTLPEKVYFIFDIFSQENWNEIYLLRFPFWTTTNLSHSLARSLIP